MISVILPSIRPHNLGACIQSIIAAAEGRDSLFELILVTDFKHEWSGRNIKSVYAPKRRGVVSALNLGLLNSEGDYLFTLSDEALLSEGAMVALKNMCDLYNHKVLLTPVHLPPYPFYYYGKWFAAFPFAHRSLIEKVGGFFDPVYKCFYADPDLSLRAYANGFDVKPCPYATIYHPNNMACKAHQHNVNAYFEADREVFKKRWAHLGEFKDP